MPSDVSKWKVTVQVIRRQTTTSHVSSEINIISISPSNICYLHIWLHWRTMALTSGTVVFVFFVFCFLQEGGGICKFFISGDLKVHLSMFRLNWTIICAVGVLRKIFPLAPKTAASHFLASDTMQTHLMLWAIYRCQYNYLVLQQWSSTDFSRQTLFVSFPKPWSVKQMLSVTWKQTQKPPTTPYQFPDIISSKYSVVIRHL